MGCCSRLCSRFWNRLKDVFTPRLWRHGKFFKKSSEKIKVRFFNAKCQSCERVASLYYSSERAALFKLSPDMQKRPIIFWQTVDGKVSGRMVLKNGDRRVGIRYGFFNKRFKPGTKILISYTNDQVQMKHDVKCTIGYDGKFELPEDCPNNANIVWCCCDLNVANLSPVGAKDRDLVLGIDFCRHRDKIRTGQSDDAFYPSGGPSPAQIMTQLTDSLSKHALDLKNKALLLESKAELIGQELHGIQRRVNEAANTMATATDHCCEQMTHRCSKIVNIMSDATQRFAQRQMIQVQQATQMMDGQGGLYPTVSSQVVSQQHIHVAQLPQQQLEDQGAAAPSSQDGNNSATGGTGTGNN